MLAIGPVNAQSSRDPDEAMADVVGINNKSHNLAPIIGALRNGTLRRSRHSAASRSIELEDRAVRIADEAVVN